MPEELLWKNTPLNKIGDIDHLLNVIDWKLNLDPEFVINRFMRPKAVRPIQEMQSQGYIENWICY